MDRSTSTGTPLNWRMHGCLAGWRTWPARVGPPDASQSLYDAVAHSSSVIAGLALDQNHETDRQRRDEDFGQGGQEQRHSFAALLGPQPKTPSPPRPAVASGASISNVGAVSTPRAG